MRGANIEANKFLAKQFSNLFSVYFNHPLKAATSKAINFILFQKTEHHYVCDYLLKAKNIFKKR